MKKAKSMRVYDRKREEWIELVAQRTAKEVVEVMKQDFLKNKSPIEMLDIVYREGEQSLTLPLFVDSKKLELFAKNYETTVDEYKKMLIGGIKELLKTVINEKGFNSEAKKLLLQSDYFEESIKSMLPPDFEVIIDVNGQEKYYKSSYNISIDLTNESDVPTAYTNFKVSYIFNDYALDKYSYLSEERKSN